jgi:hypothetical protein
MTSVAKDPEADFEQAMGTVACPAHLSFAKTPSARNPLIIQVVPSTLQPMIEAKRCPGIVIMAALRERRDLALGNLALQQQLGMLKRRNGVPETEEGRPSVLVGAFPNLGPFPRTGLSTRIAVGRVRTRV